MASRRGTNGRLPRTGLTALLLAAVVGVSATLGTADDSARPAAEPAEPAPPAEGALHPVRIHLPPDLGQTRTGLTDALGRPSTVRCVDCHSKREEAAVPPSADELTGVHAGLAMNHGGLSCFACHDNTSDYTRLRLADGTTIPFEEVMTLCSQCHGPQRRDYDHGAHGGMAGYWDLSRGPRERNACVVCHDAHSPAFPRMQPTFKPIDRFLTPPEDPHGH